MTETTYRAMHRLNGMEFIVLPDDDERLKDLEPGCIGCDGRRFYVPESYWEKLKAKLINASTGTIASPMQTSIEHPLESTSQQAGVRLSTSRD